VFMLDGHRWLQEPGLAGTNLLSAATIGPLEVITLIPIGGAGGNERIVGDYLYGDQRMPYREAGLWGLMRVYPPDAAGTKLQMLPLH
jgi:manganese oxidase